MQAISNGHNGQYFTPTPICDMMSAMSIGDNSRPGQTICDPACGSGRMLLAAAKINRHIHFYGADLDITCCKMAIVNIMLNSLTGEIAHINTLSNEFYRGYKTNTTIVNGYHVPYFVEFAKADESYICLHDLKGTAAKPIFDTLFQPVRLLHLLMVYKPHCFEVCNALTTFEPTKNYHIYEKNST
ncbi:23S rRNA G2445 N2-methylase RlmL [Mucilaginibacter sp. UYP25]|uniref:N-6 DNA methylase n=1 Tax=unclassified Mucilaginibacter TaxID=2617802 RepID=UPI0033920AD4